MVGYIGISVLKRGENKHPWDLQFFVGYHAG